MVNSKKYDTKKSSLSSSINFNTIKGRDPEAKKFETWQHKEIKKEHLVEAERIREKLSHQNTISFFAPFQPAFQLFPFNLEKKITLFITNT